MAKLTKLQKMLVEEINKYRNDVEYFKKTLLFSMDFPEYKFYETALIFAQNSNAIEVKTAFEWNEENLYIRAGQNGIELPNKRVYDLSDLTASKELKNNTEKFKYKEIIENNVDNEKAKNILTQSPRVICETCDSFRNKVTEIAQISLQVSQINEKDETFESVSSFFDIGENEEIINKIIRIGSNIENGKYRIIDFFENNQSLVERVKFLKNEYGIGGMTSDDIAGIKNIEFDNKGMMLYGYGEDEKITIPWVKISRKISELIKENSYLSDSEKEKYSEYRKIQQISQDTQNEEIEQINLSNFKYNSVDNKETIYYDKSNPDELVTKEMLEKLPKLYSQDGIEPHKKTVHAAYIIPFKSNWTWYMTEYDRDTNTAFGLVAGDYAEWGYFSLDELKELNAQRLVLEDFPKTFEEIRDTELTKQFTEEEIHSIFNGKLDKILERDVKTNSFEFKILREGMEVEKDEEKFSVVSFDEDAVWIKSKKYGDTRPFIIYKDEYKNEQDILFKLKPTSKIYIKNMKVEYKDNNYVIDHLFDYVSFKEMHLKDNDGNIEKIYYNEEKELYNIVFPVNEELKTEQQKKSEYEIEQDIQTDIADEKLKRETLIGKSFEKDGKKYIINSFKEDKILLDEEITDPTEKIIFSGGKHLEEFVSDYSEVLDNLLEKEKLQNNTEAEKVEKLINTDYQQYIGKTVVIDDSKFIIESVSENGKASMRDITFQEQSGFPIFRNEDINFVISNLRNNSEDVLNEKAEPFILTDEVIPQGKRNKFKANIAAINLLKNIEKENRYATEEEKIILSQYSGFGGIQEAFDESIENWREEYSQLKNLLTSSEYEQARASTLNAHYTPKEVIDCIYETLQNMGFEGGNILDPCCGIGKFYSYMPKEMQEKSKLEAVEIDGITGRIAQQLHQKVNLQITGYQSTAYKDNYYDLIVSNVPFGEYKISDKRNKGYIHDYFFLKSLEQVKPGGIVAFITSTGTLDKQNPAIRKKIAQKAELIGAVRLPDNTFTQTADTRGVTTDVIFLQKRTEPCYEEPKWVYTGAYSDNEEVAIINQYFIDNPQNMLGELKMVSSRFGKMVPTIKETFDLSLREKFLKATKTMSITSTKIDNIIEKESDVKYIPANDKVKNFTFTVIDDEIYYRENDIMILKTFNRQDKERIKHLCLIKESYKQVRDYQLHGEFSNDEFNKLLENLNRKYDNFYTKFGEISIEKNIKVFREDIEYPLVESLEKIVVDDDGNKTYTKSDMFFKPTIKRKTINMEFNNSEDILNYTIAEKGNVDIEYMATLTDKPIEQLLEELSPFIFENPKTYNTARWKKEYFSKEEYLSGNVRKKLKDVKILNEKYSGVFEKHIQALESVQPIQLTATDIEVRLSAHWIDAEYINQFIYEILDIPRYYQGEDNSGIYVEYSDFSNEWKVKGKSKYRNVAITNIYGTHRASALFLIEQSLNQKIVKISDRFENDGKTTYVENHAETIAARAKQTLINEKFKEWIFQDIDRRQELVDKYNILFNSTVTRKYDGLHIQLENSNTDIKLRPHQLNAVSRMRTGKNTLLAHVVGAGKTYTMIAGGMEQIRLGIANKLMFVVPNHLLRDFAGEFLNLYPTANIIVPTEKDFKKSNRQRFISKIVTSDIDAVILAHSQFEKISISPERKEIQLRKELTDLEHAIMSAKSEKNNRITVKQLENKKAKQLERLKELLNRQDKDEQIYFEELGCDSLIVDEAHAYKNGEINSKIQNVPGLSNTSSLKASDMLVKCRYLNEIGGTITFATGTPISNSISELYIMQRYLQEDTLNSLNIYHFDEWISNFGEIEPEVELKPEGTGYRTVTRISKYYNLPELMSIFNEVADIQTAEMLKLPTPKLATGKQQIIACEPSDELLCFMDEVVSRSENIRSGAVKPYEDNMLKVSSDARKAGTDIRLYDENSTFDENGKLSVCAEKVYSLYKEYDKEKATQIIFSDIGVPSNKFNVYDELKRLLVEKGIPEQEIAFIHNFETQAKKKELFADMRSGIKRILIGSTDKCGAGTNVQDRLIALHHIDCPWKPSSVEQREGRILRQGNMFDEVNIFRYVTKKSFDAYMWQLLEKKQRFVSQVMNGNSLVRNCEDINEAVLSYSEVKTIATGNPLIKEKHNTEMRINQLSILEKAYQKEKYEAQDKMSELPKRLEREKVLFELIKKDADNVSSYDEFSISLKGKIFTERSQAGKEILSLLSIPLQENEMVQIGEFREFKIGVKYEMTSIGRTRMMYLHNNHRYKTSMSESGIGCITKLENLYNKQIQFDLKQSENRINEYSKEIVQIKDVLKNDFSHKDEMLSLKQRLVEINSEIDKEAKIVRKNTVDISLSENKTERVIGNTYDYL